MRKRLQKQRKLSRQMVQGIFEIDYAEKRYIRRVEEKENRKQAIIDSKLKPKGFEMLKK